MDPERKHDAETEEETGVVDVTTKTKRGRKKKVTVPHEDIVVSRCVINHGTQSLGYSGRLHYGPDFWKGILE